MRAADGDMEPAGPATARRGADAAFSAVLGAGRGGGRRAAQDDSPLGVRALVLDILNRNAGETLRVVVDDDDRWVAVTRLDDARTLRQARSFPSRDAAVAWLEALVDTGIVAEYLIDLDVADRDRCCWPYDTTRSPRVGPPAAFTETNLSFA